MGNKLTLALLAGLSLSMPISAQDEQAARDDKKPTEEIIVEGDRALPRQVANGFAAFHAGDFEKAADYFNAIRLQEFRNKADLFAELIRFSPDGFYARPSHASVDFRKSDPWRRQAYAILYYMEGMSKRALGESNSASRSFKLALDMNPKHFDARVDYALVQIELGEPKKAEKHIRRLAKDLRKCDPQKDDGQKCLAIRQRLMQVELAYGDAVTG